MKDSGRIRQGGVARCSAPYLMAVTQVRQEHNLLPAGWRTDSKFQLLNYLLKHSQRKPVILPCVILCASWGHKFLFYPSMMQKLGPKYTKTCGCLREASWPSDPGAPKTWGKKTRLFKNNNCNYSLTKFDTYLLLQIYSVL